MGTPTPPGTPAVLPDAHSASINTNRDDFDFQSSFPSLQVKNDLLLLSHLCSSSQLLIHWNHQQIPFDQEILS